MRNYFLLILISHFCWSISEEVTKDVVYLPSSRHEGRQTLLGELSSGSSFSTPMAWIAGDLNKNALKQITVCTWVKSLDQKTTGTIFAYVKSDETIEFGLVGSNENKLNNDNYDPHEVRVVIKGKRSKIPINFGLDDARWHHICVTWSSRYGIWKVYKDGEQIARGLGMKRGKSISPGGRYYLGGGVFKWIEEEKLVNGSDVSQLNIRVSTRFHTESRKKRNVVSTESRRMAGKFTDFYIWRKVVSKSQVEEMSQCDTEFRRKFKREVKKDSDFANIFGPMRRRKVKRANKLAWASRNVLFAWNENAVTLQMPATLKFSGDICGYTISIDCETNRILISLDMVLTEWYKAEREDIHLVDTTCVPNQKGDYLVFDIRGMQSCGTYREIVKREVVYTNTITNSPKAGNVFVGHLFRAKVVCKFPLDVRASTSSIIPGQSPEVASKTTVANPVTGKPDMEGIFVLSKDDQFEEPVRQGSTLTVKKSVWAGIAIEGIYSDDTDDVKVVVDKCWTEVDDDRSSILEQQGCGNSVATILDNGEKPNVRMEVPTENFRLNVPTYIGCSFHPCVGDNCSTTCENQEDRPSVPSSSSTRRRRDIIEEEAYEIKIGPFVATQEEINHEIVDEHTRRNDEESGPDLLLLAIILPSVFVFILILAGCAAGTYILSRKTRRVLTITRSWGDGSNRRKSKSKHPARAHSFTFCRPNYSAHNIYPPSFHAIVRSKFQPQSNTDVIEENDVTYHENTNTMISTVQ